MNQRVEKLEPKVSSLISVQNRCRQVMERFIELFNKLNMSITQEGENLEAQQAVPMKGIVAMEVKKYW